MSSPPSAAPVTAPAAAICPGNHDGVHRGHRALIARARERATAAGLRVVGLTFDPHPATVVAPESAPPALTTARRREELLLGAGADAVVVQRFDHDLARVPADRFVRDVLVGSLAARVVVVGANYRFGAKAAGDVAMLRALGAELGFDVETVPPVEHEGRPISSTRIRDDIASGAVPDAAAMLDRLHDVDGLVIEGDHRGRTLGFPTANLRCDPVLLPADGVYAVLARVLPDDAAGARSDGARELVRGVANLGTRPTFAAGRSVEVHLLDFDRDVYGQRVRVAFAERLRSELKFSGPDALRAQIELDVKKARESLRVVPERLTRWI